MVSCVGLFWGASVFSCGYRWYLRLGLPKLQERGLIRPFPYRICLLVVMV